MKYILQYIACALFVTITTISPPDVVWSQIVSIGHIQADKEIKDFDNPKQSERSVMIDDIVGAWNIGYDREGLPQNYKQRDKFQEYAEYLTDAMIFYQNNKSDIGGKLPIHSSTHFMLASMVFEESRVKPRRVGKKGDVGLLQVLNKDARNGHTKKEIRDNPELGIKVGVRWLTATMPTVGATKFLLKWKDNYWLKPVSLYVAGKGALKDDNSWGVVSMARKRVRLMKLYRKLVYAQKDKE